MTLSEDGRTVIVDLLQEDLNILNSLGSLATTINDTFLTIPAGAVADFFGNFLSLGIDNGGAIQAIDFVPDITPIELASYSIDVNQGLLSLTFSETYLPETFTVTAITIQGIQNASLRTDSYNLTGASSVTPVSITVLDVVLIESDLNAIKARRDVAAQVDNTFCQSLLTLFEMVVGILRFQFPYKMD